MPLSVSLPRRHALSPLHGGLSLTILLAFGCGDGSEPSHGSGGAGNIGSGGDVNTTGSGGALLTTGGTSGGGGTQAAGGSSDSISGGGPNSSGGGGSTDVLADVTVRAGTLSRDHTIVSFQYAGANGQVLALRDAEGEELPVQVDANGVATFILPTLAANAEATFSLTQLTGEPSAGVTATEVGGVVRLGIGESTVADFRVTSTPPSGVDAIDVRAGYLHPVYTPAGTVVTDDYPEDHRWHHGIWTAWTQAEFNGHVVDFWNTYKNEGRVDLEGVEETWQGPVHAGLDAKLIHVDLVGGSTTALNERWVVRAYKTHAGSSPYFVFDLESTQTAATAAPVELLQWDYGGFAFRGHGEWADVSKANFLASDGKDRAAGDGQTGRWCFLGGSVGGSQVGYAALGHPSNFRAPQTMRIHPTDPYMAFSPVKDGPFTIEPNAPYVTRFRVVTIDGAPDTALLDRLWNDYATPPEVTVTPR